MRARGPCPKVLAVAVVLAPLVSFAADWPRFRGPNGSGVAEEGVLPTRLSAGDAVWSAPLPAGISSPIVIGDRIHLTGLREEGGRKMLLTLALDRATGKVLWERPAPAETIEEVHSTSSPASATPAGDGERVVSFFGSFGLVAHDREGKELWRAPLGPFKNPFGAAASPVIAGDLVVQNCDQDLGSFLVALDKRTGKPRWRVERPGFPRGYATPILWNAGGVEQVVVAGTLRVKGYALADGRELWSRDGLARIVNSTPVLGEGTLFVSSFSPGGDAGERITMPSYDEYRSKNDADGNGLFSKEEVKEPEMKNRFLQIDADKDGSITRAEWESMARIFDAARNSILALRPDGSTAVSVAWSHEKAIPYVSSPLHHRGRIFLVKDMGIFTVLDARTGAVVKQGRLPAGGNYYSSPVACGGKVLAASLKGEVVVMDAMSLEVEAHHDLGEGIAATPAIADGRLYLRTEKRLLAFAAAPPASGGGGGR